MDVSMCVYFCECTCLCVYEWALASPVFCNPMLHLSLWTRGLLVDCVCQTLDNYTLLHQKLPLLVQAGKKIKFGKIKGNWLLLMLFLPTFTSIFHHHTIRKPHLEEPKQRMHFESHLSTLSLFRKGHHQIELSIQRCTCITRRQPTEKQHVGRLCSTLEQECRKRRNLPGGYFKCITSQCYSDMAEGSLQ